MPAISVLLTVYNGAAYLREAVDSILAQTERDFEFIIVDNASTDGSLQLLQEYSDPRIRLFPQSANLGQTNALNVAASFAQGDLLARMDADDIALPERFALQKAFLDQHPSVGLLGGWHIEIDERGYALKMMRYPISPRVIKANLLSDGNLTQRCLSHPTVMMRRDVFRQAGAYDQSYRYAQDYALWGRISLIAEIANVPEPVLPISCLDGIGLSKK